MSGSGISWATCKSAPCSRQITMPAPHHSVFTGRMPFLLRNQQRQITEGNNTHYTPEYIQQRASVVMTKKEELTLYSSSQWRRWLTASLSRACSSFTWDSADSSFLSLAATSASLARNLTHNTTQPVSSNDMDWSLSGTIKQLHFAFSALMHVGWATGRASSL